MVVNSTEFSPDGILLALARNDDQTHIYDVRYTKDVYLELRHRRRRYTHGYGITGCKWVQGFTPGGLGLVTAGSDGTLRCWASSRISLHSFSGFVRLWDSRGLRDEDDRGTLLAEVDYDVAAISLGDPRKGESRLVVYEF